MEKTNEKIAMQVVKNTVIINVFLSAFKLFAGVFAHSAAMVSDAIHSISDLISTAIVIIGIKLANKEADHKHPYGHERFECVAAIILSILIFFVGAGIGWVGLQRIISGDYSHIVIPGVLALVAAIASIAVKEGIYWYVRGAAKKIDSSVLMADAWHSRADGLSSVGSFIGIFAARMGFPIFDSIAAIIICIFILKTAISIFMDAINKMTDKACDEETILKMNETILSQEAVIKIDNLKTRLFGNKIFVDIEISVDESLNIKEAHNIAQSVHDAIEEKFPKVKHCMVHVNPFLEINKD